MAEYDWLAMRLSADLLGEGEGALTCLVFIRSLGGQVGGVGGVRFRD